MQRDSCIYSKVLEELKTRPGKNRSGLVFLSDTTAGLCGIWANIYGIELVCNSSTLTMQ